MFRDCQEQLFFIKIDTEQRINELKIILKVKRGMNNREHGNCRLEYARSRKFFIYACSETDREELFAASFGKT